MLWSVYEFNPDPIFDASLFVEIRKRMNKEAFDLMNQMIIEEVSKEQDKKHIKKAKSKNQSTPNKGKLQIDATVADQKASYLSKSCQA